MIERFVERRRSRWERLSALLDRASSRVAVPGRGPVRNGERGHLSVDELDELVRLYRQTTSDLAIARRDFPGDRVTQFLNQLVARGYTIVYREPPRTTAQIRAFFGRDLPRAYRAAWPFLAAAAALLFIPLLVTLVAVLLDPPAARLILPSELVDEIEAGHTWFDIDPSVRPLEASLIFTNNIEVSFLALAGGMLAGVGTVYVLVSNGLEIGAVFGALAAHHLVADLVGFVSPHGFLELSVVVVSGACGLMLGKALLWPGLVNRSTALAAAGGRAVVLLLGVLPFLVVAGLIEGNVSPAHFPWPYKVAIGVTTAVVMYGYLLLAGRAEDRPRS